MNALRRISGPNMKMKIPWNWDNSMDPSFKLYDDQEKKVTLHSCLLKNLAYRCNLDHVKSSPSLPSCAFIILTFCVLSNAKPTMGWHYIRFWNSSEEICRFIKNSFLLCKQTLRFSQQWSKRTNQRWNSELPQTLCTYGRTKSSSL